MVASDPVLVTTSFGEVLGRETDGVLQFFDIPYGKFESVKPFQEPDLPNNWTTTRDKLKHNSLCPQMKDGIYEYNYDEENDCLSLSIFTPSKTDPSGKSEKFAVLFHIHDSSYASGSGDPNVYNPKNLVDNNIILVLPNYRLGALGFMCLLNETAPGNAALKDLALALNWIKNEIEKFGGNSSNIVVSGAGVGGALVEYLLISNTSRKYISRAITESGFSLSPWAIDRNPLATASPLKDLLKDTLDIRDIVTESTNIEFRPCIEKENGFITESPWQLLKEIKIELTYMVGTVNHAAWHRAVERVATEDRVSMLNSNASLFLPDDLVFHNDDERQQIGRQVRSLYFGARNITATDVNQLSQLITDSEYLNPGLRGARLLLEGGSEVYFYEYSFNNPALTPGFNASTRGNSLDFVFGRDPVPESTDSMKNVMIDLWTSFIKTG
ncbi:neuroligin-4, Y-linked-like [Bicyclus anynana]|uniref:Neuroligin-4, Y-linked-like n=1 Tax=Bicyclus anynana TaxID=110368 RepID=A0ABM3LYL4_BICAN|nr:neuroligin-4, Y-linked-like [Bicyclus anynana]